MKRTRFLSDLTNAIRKIFRFLGRFTIHLLFDGYWLDSDIDKIPSRSGIYGVYICKYRKPEKEAGKGTFELRKLIYIGEAENVRKHIIDHEKKQEWNAEVPENLKICYNFADISSPDRERAKCAIIFIHKPKYNVECKSHFTFPDTIVLSKGKHDLIKSHITALSSLGDYYRKDLNWISETHESPKS